MAEMTLKDLKETIRRYRDNGELGTSKRFIMNYRKMKGFDYEKELADLMEYEKKQSKKKVMEE